MDCRAEDCICPFNGALCRGHIKLAKGAVKVVSPMSVEDGADSDSLFGAATVEALLARARAEQLKATLTCEARREIWEALVPWAVRERLGLNLPRVDAAMNKKHQGEKQ